jgi:tRNA 2-thiouridine synthesizing protein A
MISPKLKNIEPDLVLDARGTACPGPLLAAQKAIANCKPGEILEVLSSDPGTMRDIPSWAETMNYQYLGTINEHGYFRIFMKK